MTDRDTFAAAALTGLLASNPYDQAMTYSEYANESYRMADAMLRERERVTEPLPKEKQAEVSFTLTTEERKAILDAARAYELDSDEEECAAIAATLRALLERLP